MNDNLWKFLYGSSALIGIISLIWGVEIFNLTFIDFKILFLVAIIPTLILFFLIRNHYLKIYKTSKLYFPLLQSLCSLGFLFISLVLILNYHLANGNEHLYNYEIIETGELDGRNHKPFAVIEHKGQTKKLVFKGNPELTLSSRIELKVQNGFLGYEIIKHQEIID